MYAGSLGGTSCSVHMCRTDHMSSLSGREISLLHSLRHRTAASGRLLGTGPQTEPGSHSIGVSLKLHLFVIVF